MKDATNVPNLNAASQRLAMVMKIAAQDRQIGQLRYMARVRDEMMEGVLLLIRDKAPHLLLDCMQLFKQKAMEAGNDVSPDDAADALRSFDSQAGSTGPQGCDQQGGGN